jgi:hypothetical protein
METRTCKHCGNPFEVPSSSVQQNCSKSCGAHASKNKKHGRSFTPIYNSWRDMRQRCEKPYRREYPRYGGRGIKVCERWKSFDNFLADMGEIPGKGYTLERIDNDGDYEPSNCKWGTRLEQSRNRRIVFTAEQDAKIREGAAAGLTFKQIAAIVGRSKGSVTARAHRMGVRVGRDHLPSFYASKGGFGVYTRSLRNPPSNT